MNQIVRNGVHELRGSVNEHPDLHQQWLTFVAHHLYTYSPSRQINNLGFTIEARSRSIDGFTMARVSTTAGKCQLQRTAAGIQEDKRDGYTFYMPYRGSMGISQFGRSQTVAPGAYSVISASDLMTHTKSGDNDTLCLMLPRGFVDERVVNGEDICARPSVVGAGMHNLLIETVNAFQKNVWLMSDEELRTSIRLVGDLILFALSGSTDTLSANGSVRAGNLGRAKRIIRRRLGDPDLTLSDVAQESGLSLRYLHDLFRDEGRTMWEFLKTERLQRARRLLERASPGSVRITDVSLECGFSNMSQFSTAFKRAFGISPRDALNTR